MKYKNGTKIRLGDKVLISGRYRGVVVADIDGSEYAEAYPKSQWEYLAGGVMIDTDFGGLVHYQQKDMDGETIELDSSGKD